MTQQAGVQRFVDACAGDEDVVAAFIGGSSTAVNLMRLQADFGAAADGYRKVERALGVERLAGLRDTVCALEPAAMWHAQRRLGDQSRRVGTDLAQRQHVEYPTALDRLVSDRLARLSERTGR